MKRLRNYLFAGLIVLLPIVATWQVLVWLFHLVDGPLRGVVAGALGRIFEHPDPDFFSIPGLGLILTLLIILLVGLLAANFIGRSLIGWSEKAMQRLPLVRGVYGTMKQITDAFVRQDKTAFKRVALIEYPRQGIYTLCFVTGEATGEMTGRAGRRLVGVFVPTTPNPTSGFLLYLPAEDVVVLDMLVEDGLKLVISGGVFVPEARAVAAAAEPGDPPNGGDAS